VGYHVHDIQEGKSQGGKGHVDASGMFARVVNSGEATRRAALPSSNAGSWPRRRHMWDLPYTNF